MKKKKIEKLQLQKKTICNLGILPQQMKMIAGGFGEDAIPPTKTVVTASLVKNCTGRPPDE